MLNRATLIGHLGGDPEIRATQSGRRCAGFSIATSERWTDKASGEKKEHTDWHRIIVWNENLVGIIEKYLRKGSKCLVEGKMATRKWTDKDGVDRYVTEVVLNGFEAKLVLLDKKEGGVPPANGPEDYGRDYGAGAAPAAQSAGEAILDDEIPF
jgi:single-strand DNA-binding protein